MLSFFVSALAGMAVVALPTVSLQKIDVPLDPWKRISVDRHVMQLMHGEHLDNVLKDMQDAERTPSLIYFHDITVGDPSGVVSLHDYVKAAEAGVFGGREKLLMASYDVGEAPKRIWFHMNPERNLTYRFLRPHSVSKLPVLAFLPRKCNGWTKWCDPGGIQRIVGGECYVEQCSDWEIIEPDKGDLWVKAVQQKLADPENIPRFRKGMTNMEQQQQYLRSRDTVTARELVLELQQARSLPRFTATGFKLMNIGKQLHDLMLEFYHKYQDTGRAENWNIWGQTQFNGAEAESKIVDIQQYERDKYYDEIVRKMLPKLEKWVGVPLEQTSLFGMREYRHPAVLRNHLDRPDVLVVSCTFSVYQEGFNHSEWPLEVLGFDGYQHRVEHPMGTVLYYESATLQHGKPIVLPKGGLHTGLFLHYRPKFWEAEGYVEFSEMRAAKSVTIAPDGDRTRAKNQEGWPKNFYDYADGDSDMEEGTYFLLNNTCGDPADQRDETTLPTSKPKQMTPLKRKKLGEALMDASKTRDSVELVADLIERGADVNFADDNFWRPIHEAARLGDSAIIQLLAQNRADLGAVTRSGDTALDLAKEHKDDNPSLLELLTSLSTKGLEL